MKKIIIIMVSLVLLLTQYSNAQNRRNAKYNARKKKTIVVHNKRHAHAHRKRVKRTKVAHYHYRHLPKRGAIVKSMHADARIIKHNGIKYRFYSGVWYMPKGNNWVVVGCKKGVKIRTLPVGYQKIVVGPKTYYYYYGTYYVMRSKKYEVVEAPIGAEIYSLPEGNKTVKLEGSEHYELDGVYYMPSINDQGEEILIAVKNKD
ncbi:DUF6515 family protein [Saccharicrinis aurantiacus]|uniref:DUF6515 family protein n=1 Tax=Saccharicrinis aurantiacus TaxID=1849719 RepID=UPI0008392114|nr:DUF6515 family protein [Saccharicrinis aurantiacus]